MTKGIIGAVIGDIVGSSRESKPVSRFNFKLFTKSSTITDDTVLTAAVAEWMLDREHINITQSLLKWSTEYPNAGYGSSFKRFRSQGSQVTPGSTHNGAPMRVSSVGYLASSIGECLTLARESAQPSHNSPEAIVAAQATAVAIHLALRGVSKAEIQDHIESMFGYNLHRSYDDLRAEIHYYRQLRDMDYEASHRRIIEAGTTVQDALIAFLEGDSYEDVIRKAIYLGGDADTEAAIAGGIAAAYYGVPDHIIQEALIYIPSDILEVINKVDGTSWQASKLIPPKSSRWSRNDIIICGTTCDELTGERAFNLIRPSRFHRHFNEGYPIHIVDGNLDEVKDHIFTLRCKCESDMTLRWHLHEIGLDSGRLTIEEFKELFSWALELDNVLVTPTLMK